MTCRGHPRSPPPCAAQTPFLREGPQEEYNQIGDVVILSHGARAPQTPSAQSAPPATLGRRIPFCSCNASPGHQNITAGLNLARITHPTQQPRAAELGCEPLSRTSLPNVTEFVVSSRTKRLGCYPQTKAMFAAAAGCE